MTETRSGAVVNEHYLNKVLALSEEMGVTATEDIYDTSGMKLLAQGAKVSSRLQERLIVHRLRKPIEACITVDGGVDGEQLADCAERASAESPALAAILASAGTTIGTVRRELSALRFSPAMAMMLTMIGRDGKNGLRHAVEVAALGLAFAARARLAPDVLRVVCMAGVLHDIGELYINPDLIQANRILTAEEWSHVIVHPHIARLLIQDLQTCPPEVGIAVAEHHERLNGAGYPRAIVAGQFSMAGQWVASAELISGMLHKPNALPRAELALKIVSGEHPRMVAGIVSQACRALCQHDIELEPVSIEDEQIVRLSARIADASELAGQMARGALMAPKHLDLLMRTRERLAIVQRAFVATGLDMRIAVMEGAEPTRDEAFEGGLALFELGWRVRDIGRDLAIQLGAAASSIRHADRLLGLLCG